eukprot:4613311-Amphidinium_carterae.1
MHQARHKNVDEQRLAKNHQKIHKDMSQCAYKQTTGDSHATSSKTIQNDMNCNFPIVASKTKHKHHPCCQPPCQASRATV